VSDLVIDQNVINRLDELKIQAMMFDMDIDYETASLVPKSNDKPAFWLTKWKDKQNDCDRQPSDYEG
jgi:hypothetical protein